MAASTAVFTTSCGLDCKQPVCIRNRRKREQPPQFIDNTQRVYLLTVGRNRQCRFRLFRCAARCRDENYSVSWCKSTARTTSTQYLKTGFAYFLKPSPCSSSALLKMGMDAFPIPCKARISFSLYIDSCFKSVIPMFVKARRAGALNKERNPSNGFRAASQIGQVGQSLLL